MKVLALQSDARSNFTPIFTPSSGPAATSPALTSSEEVGESSSSFAVTKHVALVPSFRETEFDMYFSIFERLAVSLKWP